MEKVLYLQSFFIVLPTKGLTLMGEKGGEKMTTLFVRCGDRFSNPDADRTITLSGTLQPQDIPAAVAEVRAAISGDTRLIVAGPGGLSFALGMALEHIPFKVEYVQLNQATKAYEVWTSNVQNL